MAQYRIDPEQKAALEAINESLNSVRILNRLLVSEDELCISTCEADRRRKRGEAETIITVDKSQRDRILSVLTVQRARTIREITALAKKHDIELDKGEREVISVGAISQSEDTAQHSSEQAVPD